MLRMMLRRMPGTVALAVIFSAAIGCQAAGAAFAWHDDRRRSAGRHRAGVIVA
jgi:hypothetical protein